MALQRSAQPPRVPPENAKPAAWSRYIDRVMPPIERSEDERGLLQLRELMRSGVEDYLTMDLRQNMLGDATVVVMFEHPYAHKLRIDPETFEGRISGVTECVFEHLEERTELLVQPVTLH